MSTASVRKPVLTAVFALLTACGALAHAQDFPTRPVRMIVPFPPGGSGDTLARLMGQKLTETWGKPVVVENRPGGNTIIAAEVVVKAAPDGHTLLIAVDSTLTMNQSLYTKLPYRPTVDLVPVTLLAEQSLLLSATPRLAQQVRTVKDFLDYVRANPGKVNLGIGAIVTQVTAELLKSSANLDYTIVPFKGSQPTLAALLAGDIDFTLSDIGPYAALIRDGKVRGLASTGAKRTPALPELPTLAESGLPAIQVKSWFGMVAPAGTPPAVIAKLNADVRRALQAPEVKDKLLGFGLEVNPMSPQEFADLIRSQAEGWEKVIRTAGIKLD